MSRTFKSYVDIGVEEHELKVLGTSGEDSFSELQTPQLLPGELLIAEAKNVLLYVPLSERNHGWSGSLTVTNFKLSFVTREGGQKEGFGCQHNFLLGDMDVSLTNIDVVYQLDNSKRRRLLPGSSVSSKIKGLQVVCKNMRVLTFSFKFCPVNNGKTLTNALLHHAFPRRHQLLFAYDYRKPSSYQCSNAVCMFQDLSDWQGEVERTQCAGWRVSLVNQHYQLSSNLPAFLVVPESVLDWQLGDAARYFRGSRPPVWCWGSADGAALVRMADILPTITDRRQESVMLEQVRKVHPTRTMLYIVDLQKILPTPRDIQQSFFKLRELCTPDSMRQFWSQDSNYLVLLDTTKWLHIISSCLVQAIESAKAIRSGSTVILQEGEGRDLTTVISSLVQLLCDPSSRSIAGFQSLVQKEWVALGHPFCSRLGPVEGSELEQSPIFLVFLDCVWQVIRQFPYDFEFTETYLTTLWDSAHIGIFDTFLFDCERDRKCAVTDHQNPLHLRSVWDWEEQFSSHDIALFRNPLYDLEPDVVHTINGSCIADDLSHLAELSLKSRKKRFLPASSNIANLELWMQCYCRWLPILEIAGGGQPQVNFQVHLLVEHISCLQQRLCMLKSVQRPVGAFGCSEELSSESEQWRNRLQSNPNSFFPFAHHRISSTELFLNSSGIGDDKDLPAGMMDSQLNLHVAD